MAQFSKFRILPLTLLYQCWTWPSFILEYLKLCEQHWFGKRGFFKLEIDFLFCLNNFVQDCRWRWYQTCITNMTCKNLLTRVFEKANEKYKGTCCFMICSYYWLKKVGFLFTGNSVWVLHQKILSFHCHKTRMLNHDMKSVLETKNAEIITAKFF